MLYVSWPYLPFFSKLIINAWTMLLAINLYNVNSQNVIDWDNSYCPRMYTKATLLNKGLKVIFLHTKDHVRPHFLTTRREMKTWCVVEYLWWTSRCLKIWSFMFYSVGYIFLTKTKTKKWRNKNFKYLICPNTISIRLISFVWVGWIITGNWFENEINYLFGPCLKASLQIFLWQKILNKLSGKLPWLDIWLTPILHLHLNFL